MADLIAGDTVTPREFILADENGPVPMAGADVMRTTVSRSGVTQVADAPCDVVGVGRVRATLTAAEVTAGWHGVRFRVRYGPGNELLFPSDGPRWLEAA
jgi:hypothetical protein